MNTKNNERVFKIAFSSVYPHYLTKAIGKNRTQAEVDEVIRWLTGYSQSELKKQIDKNVDFRTFFDEAPKLNENVGLITGVICGVRIEEIEDPLMKKLRYMDKLVDELAKGRPMYKILRDPANLK